VQPGLVLCLLRGAAGFAPTLPACGARIRASRFVSPHAVEFVDPDVNPAFVSEELTRTWERAGKGKQRWQPGDESDDYKMDQSLLWTSWKLTPPVLSVREGCRTCFRVRLVLGWSGFPFETDVQTSGPRLSGAGLPHGADGMVHASEICSFAVGVGKECSIAPATGRADVDSWLDRAESLCKAGEEASAPLLSELETLLHGRVREHNDAPCLNAWGLSIDDALVVPLLFSLALNNTPLGNWPPKVLAYLESACLRANLGLPFDSTS